MAFTPETQAAGNLIKATDWNDAMNEIVRLETAKLNSSGDNTFSGSLTIDGSLGINTSVAPQSPLEIKGAIKSLPAEALSGPDPVSTPLHFFRMEEGNDFESGTGFNIMYETQNPLIPENGNALVFEKRDGTTSDPQEGALGGFVFQLRNSGPYRSYPLVISRQKVNIDQTLEVRRQIKVGDEAHLLISNSSIVARDADNNPSRLTIQSNDAPTTIEGDVEIRGNLTSDLFFRILAIGGDGVRDFIVVTNLSAEEWEVLIISEIGDRTNYEAKVKAGEWIIEVERQGSFRGLPFGVNAIFIKKNLVRTKVRQEGRINNNINIGGIGGGIGGFRPG